MAELGLLLPILNGFKCAVIYGIELNGVSEASLRAKRSLEVAEQALNTLRRLAREHLRQLSENDQSELLEVIRLTNEAICQIAEPLQGPAQDIQDYGTMTLRSRIRWTMFDGNTVKDNLQHLQQCCSSVNTHISRLWSLPPPQRITMCEGDQTDIVASNLHKRCEKDSFPNSLNESGAATPFSTTKTSLEGSDDEYSRKNRKRKHHRSHHSIDEGDHRVEELRSRRGPERKGRRNSTSKEHEHDLAGLRQIARSSVDRESQGYRRSRSRSYDSDSDTLIEEIIYRDQDDMKRRKSSVPKRRDSAIEEFWEARRAREEEDAARRGRTSSPV